MSARPPREAPEPSAWMRQWPTGHVDLYHHDAADGGRTPLYTLEAATALVTEITDKMRDRLTESVGPVDSAYRAGYNTALHELLQRLRGQEGER